MQKESIKMYNRMMKVFHDNVIPDVTYDVDMFCKDICDNLFVCTDPQDIDEDEFLTFQEALILLVRDDTLLDWFDLLGLSMLHAEMMDYGKTYYINKARIRNDKNHYTKSDVPRFLAMLKDNNVPAENCVGLFSSWCSCEGTAYLTEKCMIIQSLLNNDMTAVWKWVCSNDPYPDTDWAEEVDRYKEAINGCS